MVGRNPMPRLKKPFTTTPIISFNYLKPVVFSKGGTDPGPNWEVRFEVFCRTKVFLLRRPTLSTQFLSDSFWHRYLFLLLEVYTDVHCRCLLEFGQFSYHLFSTISMLSWSRWNPDSYFCSVGILSLDDPEWALTDTCSDGFDWQRRLYKKKFR